MDKKQMISDDVLNKKYILNPNYILRNDINRIVLTTMYSHKFETVPTGDISTFIHPMYAVMLSFFNGKKILKDNIREISTFFNISDGDVQNIISKFILNKNTIAVEYDNNFFYFPKNILIESDDTFIKPNYNIKDFEINGLLDLDRQRLNIPLSVSLLINNKCATDCIYCYADKRKIYDCTIPLNRIKELIDEAKEIGVIDFDIRGGEIFMYKNWAELLKSVFAAGYSAYISTKCPLDENDIKRLLELGVTEVQISLDSIYEDDLIKNLCVNSHYHKKILNTISLLNEAKITIKIKSVITNQIFNLGRIRHLIDYFKYYDHVKIVEITVPSHSTFKTQEEFNAYRLNESQITGLVDLIYELKDSCKFNLSIDGAVKDVFEEDSLSVEKKKERFYRRAICTGNQSSFLILPNGDVTLCEETYFNPNLILGNILKHSIMDVWSSDKAKGLFFIEQSRFPKNSACSSCVEFSDCRHREGVCWADVISAYGEENWLYPSPDCHLAPLNKNVIKTWDF